MTSTSNPNASQIEPILNPSLRNLPNEVLLWLFSSLELKSYIKSHGVCKKWRQLLPSTNLHPIRERLLALYHRILETQDFQQTLEWTDSNLQPFDREEYIRCLLQQYPVIPEEFRMWVLEWPARLVIQCTWPRLPFTRCRMDTPISRRIGVNWIAYRPSSPRLFSLVYKYRTPTEMFIPGLLIWRSQLASETDWLIFEKDEPDLFGRVFTTHASFHFVGSIPYYPTRSRIATGDNNGDDDDDARYTQPEVSIGEECLVTFDDWIHYLEYLWTRIVEEIRYPSKPVFHEDPPIAQPVVYRFDSLDDAILPAPTWDSCQRTVDR